MRNKHVYGSLAPYISSVSEVLPFDPVRLFGRQAPLEVEIGFGTGEYISALALSFPDRDFIGLEQCAGRIIKTLRKLHLAGIKNVRLLNVDAVWAMRYFFAPGSLRALHCLFPCPWPKKRHMKHRLFSGDFLRLLNNRLDDNGTLKIVTDHHPYSDWIGEQALETGFRLERREIPPGYGTKFEKKWQAAGQTVFDELMFLKTENLLAPDYRGVELKIYSLDHFDANRIEWKGLTGALSVQFRDFMFDASRERGMVQAIISEDGCIQYLGVIISRTAKGWSVRALPGSGVLPTEGAETALRLVYEALQESGRK